MYDVATYPANLCPLFWRFVLAEFGKDLGQAIGKAIKTMSKRAVQQRPAEHFHGVLGEQQRVHNTVPADALWDRGCFRLWDEMSRL